MGGKNSQLNHSDICIRRLNEDDIPQIIAIEKKTFPSPWSDILFLNELQHDFSHFLVLIYQHKLIGYAGFWLIVDEAHLTNIAIDPCQQHKGLGSLLLRSLLQQANKLGAVAATLEVRITNKAAIALYHKFNFQDIAIRKKYYADTGEDALIMWLNPLEYKSQS